MNEQIVIKLHPSAFTTFKWTAQPVPRKYAVTKADTTSVLLSKQSFIVYKSQWIQCISYLPECTYTQSLQKFCLFLWKMNVNIL